MSRYRVVTEEDHADKGCHGGRCNVKACQVPEAYYYNRATDSYYCYRCAKQINDANQEELCTYDPNGCHDYDCSSVVMPTMSNAAYKRRLVAEHNKEYEKCQKN